MFSFRNKLLLIIFFIGVVPISITGILSNIKFNELLVNQAEDITMQALRQSEGYLTMYTSEIEQVGIFASTNEDIWRILKKETFASTYERVADAAHITEVLKQYLSARSDIERVDIFGFNGFAYMGAYTNNGLNLDEPWVKEVMARNGSPYWFAVEGGKFMVYSRVITSERADKNLGIIRIMIPSYRLESVLNRFEPLGTGFLMLIDQAGNPIISGNQDVSALLDTMNLDSGNVQSVDDHGTEMLASTYRLDKLGWTFVSAVPRGEMQEGTKQIRGYFLNTVVIILLIALSIGFWTTHRFTKPIRQFIARMADVEKENFTSRMDVRSKDELGMLAISYNRMVQRINSLINEVYEQQILKNEAEWNALQAQINPHFLYNTLDSVNWLARMHRIPSIVTMITALSKLFKLSLAKADKFITVEEELQYIRYYAQIQETRFSDRIRIIVDVPESLLQYRIPRFILQPILENAVLHGLERKEGPGRAFVKGAENGGRIFFIVQDDGVGIPADKLETLLRPGPAADKRHHLGLSNVDERIKLLYGAEWGLKIDSIENEGTIVEVWLKKELLQGGDNR